MGKPYPKDRRSKLVSKASPEYKLTFLKGDAKGRIRRYINGVCGECGNENTIIWANYSKNEHADKFRHLKCGQRRWNTSQQRYADEASKQEIAARVMAKTVSNCKKRNREFSLALDEFIDISERPCEYCGDPPSMRHSVMAAERDRDIPKFLHNGLDRVDNALGYSKSNVVACCTRCNFIKKDTPKDAWSDFLSKVSRNWRGAT